MFKFEYLTPEQQLEKQWDAAMDSVNLINSTKPESMDIADWTDIIIRNKEHCTIMVERNIFTAEQNAILTEAAKPIAVPA